MDVYDYRNRPEFMNLEYLLGGSMMLFANLVNVFGLFGGHEWLYWLGCICTVLGGSFLFGLRFPEYLLETIEDNETVDAELVSIHDWAFRIGPFFNQVLSGPYWGRELELLKMDLEK